MPRLSDWMRRGLIALASLLACSAIGGPAQAQEKVRVLLDWAWLPYHSAFLIAQQKGYFKEQGLDVDLQQGRGSATTAILVANGDFDIGHLNITNAAQAIGKGMPLKVIALYQHKSSAAFIGIKGRVKLDGIDDLKKVKIGSTPGGSDVLGMKIFTKMNHIDESSLDIISLNAEAKTVALLNGSVDVLSGDSHAYEAIVRGAGMEPVTLALRDLNVPLLGFGFVSNTTFLKSHPDTVKKFLVAVRKGFADAVRDPAAACQIAKDMVHLPNTIQTCVDYAQGLWKLSTPPTDPDWGRQSPEEWKKLVQVLQSVGELPANADPATFYTNDFLP